jgi:hypothetical protein
MKTKIFYDFEASGVSRDADMISVGLVAVTPVYDSRICDGNDNKEAGWYEEVKTFYAEFTDFNIDKCDDWVKENVVKRLTIKDYISPNEMVLNNETGNVRYKGDKNVVSFYLKQWLSQFEEIEFWADFDVIDKPMLIDLIADWDYQQKEIPVKHRNYIEGQQNHLTLDMMKEWVENITVTHKVGLPKHLPNIRYDQLFDLHTLFKIKGIDTDISREEFSEIKEQVIPLPFSDYGNHNALYDAYVGWLCYQKLMKI